MIKRSLFFTAILICSLGFLACGGGGSDDDSNILSSYVSFSAVSGGGSVVYSSSGEWTGSINDSGYGSEPICTWITGLSQLHSVGLKTTIAAASYNNNTVDHVYIITNGNAEQTFSTANCSVEIRLAGINGDAAFYLTNETVTITHADSNYVEGTFTGLDFSGYTVSGSFLFNRLADDTWWD